MGILDSCMVSLWAGIGFRMKGGSFSKLSKGWHVHYVVIS